MAFDEGLEERVAAHRGRTRQNRAAPWLIRDDGAIFPNVPNIAKKNNFRVYHGDIKAPLEERLRYLQGLPGKRRVIVSGEPTDEAPPFDLAKCTKDELIAFAEQEYGYTLDPEKNLHTLRSEFAKVAGIEYVIPAQRAKRGGLATPPAAGAEGG